MIQICPLLIQVRRYYILRLSFDHFFFGFYARTIRRRNFQNTLYRAYEFHVTFFMSSQCVRSDSRLWFLLYFVTSSYKIHRKRWVKGRGGKGGSGPEKLPERGCRRMYNLRFSIRADKNGKNLISNVSLETSITRVLVEKKRRLSVGRERRSHSTYIIYDIFSRDLSRHKFRDCASYAKDVKRVLN